MERLERVGEMMQRLEVNNKKFTNIIHGALYFDHEPNRDRLLALVDDRLVHRYARFRSIVIPHKGAFYWKEVEVDVRKHVRRVNLDEQDSAHRSIESYIGTQILVTLPASQPLWELQVIRGSHMSGFCLLARIHHTIGDGNSMVRILFGLLDDMPCATVASSKKQTLRRRITVRAKQRKVNEDGKGSSSSNNGKNKKNGGNENNSEEPNKNDEEEPMSSDKKAIDSDKKAIDSDKKAIDSDKKAIDSDKKAIDSDKKAIDKNHKDAEAQSGANRKVVDQPAAPLKSTQTSLLSILHPIHLCNLIGGWLYGLSHAVALPLLWRDSSTCLKASLDQMSSVRLTRSATAVPLARVKEIGSYFGATINDVLVALVTGAVRYYMEAHHDPLLDSSTHIRLRSLMPIGQATPPTAQPRNRFVMLPLSMPVNHSDPISRLQESKLRCDELKHSPEAFFLFALQGTLMRLSPALFTRTAIDLISEVTLLFTNVVGPRHQVSMVGEPLRDINFFVSQPLGACLSVLSYNGHVNLSVCTDANVVPDPGVLLKGFELEFQALDRLVSKMKHPIVPAPRLFPSARNSVLVLSLLVGALAFVLSYSQLV